MMVKNNKRRRRFGLALLLVLSRLGLDGVSGFQVVGGNDGRYRLRTYYSRDRTRSSARLATPQEEEAAVADFRMITENESKLRRVGGVALGVVTLASFVVHNMPASHDPDVYASLSSGTFAALATYRTGTDYQ